LLKIDKTKFVCIKSGEKMKKNTKRTFFSTNLIWIGIAFILTSALIFILKPYSIVLFMSLYIGNQILLSKALTLIGCLSTTIGYMSKQPLKQQLGESEE
jgi:hypothetical protein